MRCGKASFLSLNTDTLLWRRTGIVKVILSVLWVYSRNKHDTEAVEVLNSVAYLEYGGNDFSK